jgi:hypothetical protein
MAAAPAAAAASAAPATGGASGSGGMNPFWVSSNLYAEKITTLSAATTATVANYFQNINPGNFARGVRFIVRSTGGTGVPTADNPLNIIQSLDLENVDGGEILYPMPGYNYGVSQKYFRPWQLDPFSAYDYAQSANPSFSLALNPEIRQTACILSNTDARSQYKYNLFVNTTTNVTNGSAPTVSFTSYLDAWGQPDPQDLQGVPNQPLPPGLALQTKRRQQAGVVLQSAGTDNIFQLVNTGNAMRGIIAIVRDSNNNRQDYLSDPIRWQQDNRNLGVFSPDMLFQWNNAQYAEWDQQYGRPQGVYVFPRFFNPGALTGQGWLYTSNATKLTFETTTAATAVNTPGNVTFITDEVYPVQQAVPADLQEI